MRKVATYGNLPTGGSGYADSGFQEDYARPDHSHQLFEKGWTDIGFNGAWTGQFQFTRSGNLFMVYLECQNLGAAQVVLSNDALLNTIRPFTSVLAVAGIWQDPFDGAFRKAAVRFTNTQLTANGINNAGVSVNITQTNFVSAHGLWRVP